MTRINLILPQALCRQHLVAEYRELPRIPRAVKRLQDAGVTPTDIPPTYRMGKGHVRFFYVRCGWLQDRQRLLVAEMRRRGYNPTLDPDEPFSGLLPHWIDAPRWEPSPTDLVISLGRIEERLRSMQEAPDFTNTLWRLA